MALNGDPLVDATTKKLLNKVTKQINIQNQQLITNTPFQLITNTPFTGYNNPLSNSPNTYAQQAYQPTIPLIPLIEEVVEPNSSPYIDMEKDIYKNEFEECGSVDIETGKYDSYNVSTKRSVLIGLIDEVSEDEDDLYAKFPDGEIIPFEGHPEEFSVEIYTWNDLQKSDLIGNKIEKAATCKISINDRLARIIEGIDTQELLMKAARAIDELKVQPFSICRDAHNLIGREIYYDNQPAIIQNIDEINCLIFIIPDTNYIKQFTPPPYVLEDDESEEWLITFGQGMQIKDYDEKIWWWRNTNNSVNPSEDPYYKQFPQFQPVPPLNPYPGPYPGITTNPISPYTIPPYTIQPFISTDNITWTATATTTNKIIPNDSVYIYTDPITGNIVSSVGTGADAITITSKEQVESIDPKINFYTITRTGMTNYKKPKKYTKPSYAKFKEDLDKLDKPEYEKKVED